MKASILIIEDNKDIRESTAELLELAGYQVYRANNGKDGIELAIKHLPALILCDIMMVELDGYGVLYILSKRADTSIIPFIFITAKAERSDMRKGMDMGADDYITKPFNEIELMHAIESRLAKRATQQQIFSESLKRLNNLFSSENGLETLNQAFHDRKVRSFKKKQVIYYEGDPANAIYLICSGSVKTLKVAEDGREFVTAVYEAEEYFGITAVLGGEDYQETAEAIEDSMLCSLPKDIVDQLVYKYPDVAERFIKILAGSLLENQQQLLQLAYHSVRKRMAELLIRMHYRPNSKDIIDISRDNLAALAGMATETVSRVLSDFKEEGLIEKKLSGITIVDLSKLQRLKN